MTMTSPTETTKWTSKTDFERWLTDRTERYEGNDRHWPLLHFYRERVHRRHRWAYGLWLRQTRLDVFDAMYESHQAGARVDEE